MSPVFWAGPRIRGRPETMRCSGVCPGVMAHQAPMPMFADLAPTDRVVAAPLAEVLRCTECGRETSFPVPTPGRAHLAGFAMALCAEEC